MKKQINYLGRKWKLKRTEKMYNGYEGWNLAVFEILEKEEKGYNIKGINENHGRFNKLSDDIHIAIERIATEFDRTLYFNQLFIAFKDINNWQGELPEWNDDY